MQISKLPIEYFDASAMKVGIVAARFNADITDGLLSSAKKMLGACQVKAGNITVISVAGSVEIPFALQKLALTEKYDALVALGCVIRGETPHFDYVCKMAQEGVLRVMLDHNIPIGFGVLTTNDQPQARSRLHVGGEAAFAAIDLARL